MNAKYFPFIRRRGLLAGAVLGLVAVSLHADSGSSAGAASPQKKDAAVPAGGSEAFPVLDNYIRIGVGAPDITGDKAAYQEIFRTPYNGFAGIEDMHFSKDLKDSSFTIDGRALAGSNDYLGKFQLTKTDVGTFEAGYKRFRTFYDGVGGFFPTNKEWMPLANEALATDRAKFWAEGTINLPNMPVFKLKYANELRNGTKDSTIWGDSDFTGLAFNLAPNPVSPARKLVPGYLQLDERHQSFEASMSQTLGKTTYQVALIGDKTDNQDSRFVARFPNEVIPWSIAKLASAAQPAAKNLVAAKNWNNQVLLQQTDGESTSTTGVNAKLETAFNDMFTLHVGGNYQSLHADITGNRPLVTSTPTSTGVVPVTTATFTALTGTSHVKVYTGNAALDIKPVKDLFIQVAVRGEKEEISGASGYNVIAASGTPAVTLTTTPRVDWSKINQHSATPAVDLRYTGIKDLSLYFSGSKRNLRGGEQDTSSYNPLTATAGTLANNNNSEDHGDYKLGANWKVFSPLEVRAELFDKHHQYESAGYSVNLGDYYLLDSHFKGVKLTALAKPLPELSFTTRYVYQKGTMSVTGFLPIYSAYDSCDAKNYNISETIDWAPNKAMYVQVSGSIVFNTINTVYPRAGITPAVKNGSGVVTANAYSSNNVLQNSDNNYVTANALVGFVLTKDADVQAQYTYYKADNGDPQMAALTMPYGAASEESLVTVGIKFKLDERRVLNAKVGYADSTNDLTGGFTNFHGPLAYISIDYAL